MPCRAEQTPNESCEAAKNFAARMMPSSKVQSFLASKSNLIYKAAAQLDALTRYSFIFSLFVNDYTYFQRQIS